MADPARVQQGNATTFRGRFVDEAGTAIDVSAGSSPAIRFEKPSGPTFDKAASFVTDGSDGQIQATVAAGDLDEFSTTSKPWKWQLRITLSGSVFTSNVRAFHVAADLAAPPA